MKNLKELAVLIGMTVTIFAQGVCADVQAREQITSDVFRLHIIANSDSEEDQALKLKVRDAVLQAGDGIFGCSSSTEEAVKTAEHNIGYLTEIAEKTIRENGYDYDVECQVGKVWFDERVYGSAVLPEGEYTALRICIGEAEGKNWWCVMFPPLCLPAVTNTDEVLRQAENDGVLSREELEIISDPEKYQVRFYFVDKFKEIMEHFEDKTL